MSVEKKRTIFAEINENRTLKTIHTDRKFNGRPFKTLRFVAAILPVIALLMLCSKTIPVVAQDNPYHINNKLLPLYIRAFNNKNSAEGLLLADSLRRKAVAIGDRYGEIYSYTIPLYHHYFKKDNMKNVDIALKNLTDKAKEYKMWDIYYMAMANKASYFLRDHKYMEALLYLEEQENFAKRNGHKDGIRWAMRMKAVIQQYRGELSQAIDGFKNTIEYSRQFTPAHDPAREYISLCDCYRMTGDYSSILECAKQGEKECKNPSEKRNITGYKAYAQFMTGNDMAFNECWREIADGKQWTKTNLPVMDLTLLACRAMADGDDRKALDIISQVEKRSKDEYLRLSSAYYQRKGDLLKSIEYTKQLISSRYEYSELVMEYDSRSIDDIFYNQDIEREKQRIANRNTSLQLHNTELQLHNTQLELGKRRDAANLATATAERNSLQFDHQQLMAKELADSLKIQKTIRTAKEKKIIQRRRIYISIIIIAIITVMIIFANVMKKHSLAKKLKHANSKLERDIGKLEREKDRAQESERMKTLFVQNMSHEIRTPLNAVVGFSHLLTDSGCELSQEEREEMARYVADNSELLATIVNDIIEITTLQSDSVAMKFSPTKVNDLCREMLRTVDHRKAEGVELLFATDASDDLTIMTDRNRVSQVIINMLTNAEKNTSHGSITLKCSLMEHPGMVTLSVSDTGCGVPKDKQNEIFRRFCKLDPSKPGTGLGLDICRMIAHRLGGEINIDKEYTKGARFWFTTPLKR